MSRPLWYACTADSYDGVITSTLVSIVAGGTKMVSTGDAKAVEPDVRVKLTGIAVYDWPPSKTNVT